MMTLVHAALFVEVGTLFLGWVLLDGFLTLLISHAGIAGRGNVVEMWPAEQRFQFLRTFVIPRMPFWKQWACLFGPFVLWWALRKWFQFLRPLWTR